jgi:hypothetical protein
MKTYTISKKKQKKEEEKNGKKNFKWVFKLEDKVFWF